MLFTGAGASVELGVPAMQSMVEQFLEHLRERCFPIHIIQKIEQEVEDGSNDMEYVIDLVDSVATGLDYQRKLGLAGDSDDLLPFGLIRYEAEWFVQHICERIQAKWAGTLWAPVLRNIAEHEVTIATTNYDRAVEICAMQIGVPVEDGFESGFFEYGGKNNTSTEFAKWRGIRTSKHVHLLKLHGSTDWYLGDDGSVIKLRHAMPLYGALVLMEKGKNNPSLKSALVLPSREKMTTQPPYPSLTTEFRNRAEQVDVAFFLGTSLRDQDMRDVCSICASRIPTYLISRRGSFDEGCIPPKAIILTQSAGRFLISTLPNFLKQENFDALRVHTKSEREDVSSVLEWLVIANDRRGQMLDRCQAIEQLAGSRVRLERQEVEHLLRTKETQVRTYALGLIQDSPDCPELVKVAQLIATEIGDPVFEKETQILVQLLGQEMQQ